jgi:DNA (cytosine-5)-methyltransferase 1
MRYGSVCSGIEAATSAWHSLGWTPQWFSEIEPFPSAVLAHHYPNVPNFGDMTKFKEWKLDDSTAIDVLVGGTPCQSFSVAGLRKGLDDPRGNLMLTYLAIARKYRPKWLVWENVPGVLSSSGGEDFASLLRGMGECGYGFAYRVLDAQYFGVAQRRRRVFVVGCLGDWRAAAAVLFERHSLSGHPAPSRKARKSPPGFFESSLAQYRQADVGGTLKASGGVLSGGSETFIKTQWPAEIAPTLNAKYGEKMGLENQHIDGGAGMFTLQPIALAENTIGRQPQNGGNGDGFTVGGPMYTLNATGVHGVAQPIPLDLRNAGRDPEKYDEINRQGVGVGEPGDPAHTLTTACVHGVAQPTAYAFDAMSSNSMKSSNPVSGVNQVDVSKTLDTSRGLDPSCNQGGIGVVQSVSACDVADTLTVGANQTTGFIGDVVTHPIVLMDQGGSVMNVLEDGTVGTLRRETHGHEPVVMAFSGQMSVPQVDFDLSSTLQAKNPMAVAYAFEPGIARREGGESRFVEEMSPTLRSGMGDNQVAVAFNHVSATLKGGSGERGYPDPSDGNGHSLVAQQIVAPTLTAANNPSRSPQSSEVTNQVNAVYQSSMAVRRLTPMECERLQGFPDNHTNIPWRKKPESPDGPRYKALGNSMAVPCMVWLGKRIQMVEDIKNG